jgi:hypothetical protein
MAAACSDAAMMGGVALLIVRDWIAELDSHGPERADRKPPGIRPQATVRQRMDFRRPPFAVGVAASQLDFDLNLRRRPVRRRHLITGHYRSNDK